MGDCQDGETRETICSKESKDCRFYQRILVPPLVIFSIRATLENESDFCFAAVSSGHAAEP